jgi:hypothetical protein
MLDDLRNTASTTNEPTPDSALPRSNAQKERGVFMGMSAVQRFVLALLLFLMSCVMGAGCLLLTGKIVLPL